MTDLIPLTESQWRAAIEADGGQVAKVDDGISSYSITPAYVGFDHVDMIDLQLQQLKTRGWDHKPTFDALLDARLMWAELERGELR